jgi:NADH:ubiquinone oxidoreductase subunit 2 (subunit N)
VNTAISFYYYLRVVGTMYLSPPSEEGEISASPMLSTAVAGAGLGVLVLFVLPWPLLHAAERAVHALG